MIFYVMDVIAAVLAFLLLNHKCILTYNTDEH